MLLLFKDRTKTYKTSFYDTEIDGRSYKAE